MILLRADQELRQTFTKLIQTMKVPVEWNGTFVVIDNYIILQGEVRSLFFHFDSRKVVTNIIDLPIKEEDIVSAEGNVHLRNVINMILYVFGKWGAIEGLRVEKNYTQLNQLFMQILKEIRVEPEYNQEHFFFYRDGIRITYEDVVQFALEYEEEPQEPEEEAGGLWHKLVWKRAQLKILRVETTLEERKKGRIGNNFYAVGYLCPYCGEKLHMVVYPAGKEFQIETAEGAVLLARAATCKQCRAFFTPYPEKLFSEGDVYTMQFEDDPKAYEDYLELLGKNGDRISNSRFNRFVDGKHVADAGSEMGNEENPEEFCEDLYGHSETEIARMQARMEEGFYPDERIERLERKIKAHYAGRENGKEAALHESGIDVEYGGKSRTARHLERAGATEMSENGNTGNAKAGGREESRKNVKDSGQESMIEEQKHTTSEQEAQRQKYQAKLAVCERFSDRQLKELKEQLRSDRVLPPKEREQYLKQVGKKLADRKVELLSKKVDACVGKPYVVIKRVYDEIMADDEVPMQEMAPILKRMREQMREQGEREVRQLMEKMPPNMNRAKYREFSEKLHSYEVVDLTPYEEKLKSSRARAEQREVEELVGRARKLTKEDLKELSARLKEGDFLPEIILPYQRKIEDKIRQLDAQEIAAICPDSFSMSFEEGMEAYEKLQEGDFLPELKEDALRTLRKRLSKIKLDECELLVRKLQDELQEAGIAPNENHHFYPAKKVLLEQAEPEETEVIDFAMASYAAGKGLFEYPIFVADTSRNGTGREGILLTPDCLYYSTLFSAYGIPILSIEKITASTGLLNRGIYVHQLNGTRTKIPYAVENKELSAYAKVLDNFVRYLKEKPESRKVDYLAKDKHETICCFRCGYVYKGGAVCPKCGYKNNE